MTAGREPLPLVVLGAGAAGAGLGRAAARAGWPVAAVCCRSAERARARQALVGAGAALVFDPADPGRGLREALRAGAGPVLALLGVPDREIAPLAGALARAPWPAGSVVLHLSGSLEVAALAPLAAAGLATGGLHPLHSFVDPLRDAPALAGATAALEGDAAALAVATDFARAVGLRPFVLAPGRRALWHAAATHACNHFVALQAQALALLDAAGLPAGEAHAALLPLLRGTLENLSEHAPAAALTGPVVRGDVAVVAGHLDALRDEAARIGPDVEAAYRALARRALALAAERGLQDDRRAALEALLRPVPPDPPA